MKPLIVILILMSLSCKDNSGLSVEYQPLPSPAPLSYCTVTSTVNSTIIKCPDGSQAIISSVNSIILTSCNINNAYDEALKCFSIITYIGKDNKGCYFTFIYNKNQCIISNKDKE